MWHRRYRQLMSSLIGLGLTLGLMLGQVALTPGHGAGAPTISTLTGDPGNDAGGGG